MFNTRPISKTRLLNSSTWSSKERTAQSSPTSATWRSHLGAAIDAVPTGLYPVWLPNSRCGTLLKAGSMGCRPVREPDAHVFAIRSLLAVGKTKVAMVCGLPARYRCSEVVECGIASGCENRTPKDRNSTPPKENAYETKDQYCDVHSAFISDNHRAELSISDVPTTGIVQKHSGLEEVLRNLKKLSISDPEKKGVPEDWVRQPPATFSGKWDENVTSFLKTFTAHVDSMKLNLESTELINYFKEYLKGEALRISEPLAVIYPNWDNFVEKFSDRFNGKERIKRAKAELFKLSLYSEEVLFVFAKLKSIFEAMELQDETEQLTEILKKSTINDRNRILDKGLETFSEVLEYYLTEEERHKRFGKPKRDQPSQSSLKSSATSSEYSDGKKQVKVVTATVSKDLTKVKCFRCEMIGHYARDCPVYQSKTNKVTSVTETPKQDNSKVRKLPFSTGITAPENKRVDLSNTPTPIRKLLEKKLDVNLVDLGDQMRVTKEVTAVTGTVEVNGILVKFQYDSGASVNIISEDLVNSMELGPMMDCTWGKSQEDSFNELKQKLISAPLLQYPEWSDDFVLITDASTKGLGAILAQGKDGRDRGRLGRWVVRLSHYDFLVKHREGKSNPADFLSRFPWEDIPPAVEEVMYVNTEQYNDFKEKIRKAEDAMQLGTHTPEQEGLVDKFSTSGNEIYFKRKDRLVKYLPPAKLASAITKLHNEQHQNPYRTFKSLTKHYYIPGAYSLVKDTVERCEECQRNNYTVRRSEPFHGIQITGPFQTWGIDVAGPLPASRTYRNKYLILAVDYFTKWPVAVAVPEVNASIIIAFICEHILSAFGVPKVLVSDRGTHLSNELVATFNRYLGINHKPVTAYRPQANGQIERTIQTFKQALRKICNKDIQNWDIYLWRTLLALRTSVHRSIGKSPAEILYGLCLLTPSVWENKPIDIYEGTCDFIAERNRFISEVLPTYRTAAYNMGVKAKNIESGYYNKKIKPRFFVVGDYVLKSLAEPYSPLSDRNVGPFEVTAIKGDGVYEITDTEGNSDYVHADRLRKYTPTQGNIPVVHTGRARSTLPALVRPFRGRVNEDVLS
ncbi:Retrovirus-related Pol polyprotein from transposon [Smittium culicis]|uniref:Retrovirus-related Pol polyprotein from transposon n=1 Tax=Smittium culicis TaxID=133412 RepID=A0A1R1XTG1_9FUNG|nr:Retrovirus-related Pol polyprotein from transposon [Smittium culicis]